MSKPRMRLRVRVAFVAVLLGTSTIAAAPGAGASTWSEAACSTAEGVTVVVDFGSLGGGVHVRCAPGPVGSGFEALAAAGIDHRTALRSPGFLCRIANKPSDDPCVNTSPASAYWSYWIAPRGGQWCYSNVGAASRNPPEGTVEGWSFSSGETAATAPPPAIAVPAAVAGSPVSIGGGQCTRTAGPPASPPTTTAAPAPTAAPAAPGDTTPRAATPTTTPAAKVAPATPRAPKGDTTPTTLPSTPQTTAPAVVAGATTVIEATTTTTPDPAGLTPSRAGNRASGKAAPRVDLGGREDSDGSPLGAVAAGGLVLVLGGVAAVIRRRSRERPV